MPPFKSTLVTFAGLFIIVLAIPIYLWQEPARLEQSQADLRQQFVDEAALIYAENCALCHGPAGEGIGATPPLNSDAIHTADYDFLYKTIARGRYGTSMTGWHQEEGGPLNDYQIEALVALLRYADWGEVQLLTEAQGMSPVTLPAPDVPEALLAAVADLAPAGSTWATGIQLYADNCTVCHGVNGEGSSLAVPLNTADVRAKEALELARIISEGVPGTLMVGWHNVLTPDDIDAVVAFLQNWDQLTASGVALPTPAPVIVDLNNPLEVMTGSALLVNGSTLNNGTLEIANGVPYGLSASVWTRDLNRAHRVSAALDVGMVWVNTWLLRDLRVPFGGIKQSGVGREGGHLSLEFFSESKNVCIKLEG